jgi:hypothetical protein
VGTGIFLKAGKTSLMKPRKINRLCDISHRFTASGVPFLQCQINSLKTKTMKTNESTFDRIIRALSALVIAILYFTGFIAGTLGIILLVVAGILLLTALVGYCPLYTILGISSTKKHSKTH